MLSKMLGDLANNILRAAAHRGVDRMSADELGNVIRKQHPVLGRVYVVVASESSQRTKAHQGVDELSGQQLRGLAADKLAEALR